MTPAASAYRTRAPMLDIAQRRHAWRQLAAAGLALAERAIETDGRETIEADDLAHSLARVGKTRFDVEGDSAQGAATAFVLLANGVLKAGFPRRRAVLARALKAAAIALDELLTDQGHAEAARSRQASGERPDSD